MSSLQTFPASRRVKRFRNDNSGYNAILYTYNQILTAFNSTPSSTHHYGSAPYFPSYLGGVINFPTSKNFTDAWNNLEGNYGSLSQSFETFTSLGKQLKVGWGPYSDIIVLTLVQRTSAGLPSQNGIPGVPDTSTNGYETYYIVTESSANTSLNSGLFGLARVLVYAT
jgi:hypothetical protein